MVVTMNDGGIASGSDDDRRLESVKSIPVIDISYSYFVKNREAAAQRKIADELRKACIDVGFFYISGHGIPSDELDEAIDWSHRFFELPLDVKMQFVAAGPGQAGFVRVGGINPQANPNADLKERFVLARELSSGAASNGVGSGALSRWPTDDVLPGFTRFMIAHHAKQIALAQTIARAFAMKSSSADDVF